MTLHAQDIDVSKNITSHQLGLSRPTPLKNATLKQATHTNDADHPQTSGAYHFDSSQPTQLQCPRINPSQPTRSKLYCTNRSEEEGLTWPFASSLVVHNKGVDTVRKNNKFYRELHAVYITIDRCHYVQQKAQTATLHYTRGPAD